MKRRLRSYVRNISVAIMGKFVYSIPMSLKPKKFTTEQMSVKEQLSRLSIYELRTFARMLGFKQLIELSRHELIDIICVVDMSFNLNKLEMFLFWRELLTRGG